VQPIEDKKNVADIFTKEIKDPAHFRSMAFTLTTPRVLANWDHQTGESHPRGERGVLNVCMKPVSTLGGASNLASHLGSSPTAVAAAARAVVSWAAALANQCSALRVLP
jgi:hypothetical protein